VDEARAATVSVVAAAVIPAVKTQTRALLRPNQRQ